MNDDPPIDDNYSRTQKSFSEVERYLLEVQSKIERDLFVISERDESRKKNTEFIRIYNLSTKGQQKELLLGIMCEDFLETVLSNKEGNEGQELYVFCRKCNLYKVNSGSQDVWVYIKFDLIKDEKQPVIVVSFHECEREPGPFPFN